jgi:hypothetical protein
MTAETRSGVVLPNEITGYNGERISFERIGVVLEESTYGKMLRGKPRFDYYRPSTVTVEKWIEMLGPDVDNFLHMPYTYNLTREFLEECDGFTEAEKTTLQFCAMTHDIQEARTGDKRKIDKTEEDEKIEAELLVSMLGDVLASELDCVRLGELTGAVGDIILDEKSRLGRAFSAVEKIGYAKTALRAWEIKKQGDPLLYGISPLQTGFGLLAHSVFTYQTHKMVDYAKGYPYVRNFLVANEQEITEILEESDELETFENAKIMKLSLKSWDEFRTSLLA